MKILFPTDFTGVAENAYVYALKLADRLQGGITVIHVYQVLQVHSWVENSMDMEDVNDKITIGEFERFKEEISVLKRIAIENHLDHIEVNYSLKESDSVVEAILMEAKESQPDIIVMGTRGASGLKEIFFGSVASKIMEAAESPVFVVPDSATFRGIEKIGLTLEYKPDELQLIEKSLAIARQLGGHLHCLHIDVYDPDSVKARYLEYKEAFQHETDISFHVQSGMDVEEGILEFIKYNQIDVLILKVHRQRMIKELFSYSIAKRIAYHSDTPLIGINEV